MTGTQQGQVCIHMSYFEQNRAASAAYMLPSTFLPVFRFSTPTALTGGKYVVPSEGHMMKQCSVGSAPVLHTCSAADSSCIPFSRACASADLSFSAAPSWLRSAASRAWQQQTHDIHIAPEVLLNQVCMIANQISSIQAARLDSNTRTISCSVHQHLPASWCEKRTAVQLWSDSAVCLLVQLAPACLKGAIAAQDHLLVCQGDGCCLKILLLQPQVLPIALSLRT